jgi:mutual gliding-motility protein MglA
MKAIRLVLFAAALFLLTGAISTKATAMFLNHSAQEVNLKLIYIGPSMSGKVESVRYIHERTAPDSKGEMVTLPVDQGTTLFFDFAPKNLGTVRGYRVRFHLYTLTEEKTPDAGKALLESADGIVFVADGRKERLAANVQALAAVKADLRAQGRDWTELPRVIQLNNDRLPGATTTDEMRRALQLGSEQILPSETSDGSGVFDSLRAAAKETLVALKEDRLREWNRDSGAK